MVKGAYKTLDRKKFKKYCEINNIENPSKMDVIRFFAEVENDKDAKEVIEKMDAGELREEELLVVNDEGFNSNERKNLIKSYKGLIKVIADFFAVEEEQKKNYLKF